MRRASLLVALLLATGVPALAKEVTVADLLADGASFEGIVTVEGELVGDFQRRDAWVWVQLNGDSYADTPAPAGGTLTGSNTGIAIRFPHDAFDAAGFVSPGRYGVRGPVVRVTGEWRFHDEDRGGESYLEASSFEIVKRERAFDEGLPSGVLLAGVALLALGLFVSSLDRRRSRFG